MKLAVKNIGKISEASVEIDGITVIAGENNTGKSTISRALFASFNSFYEIQTQMETEKAHSVENVFYQLFMENKMRFRCEPGTFYEGAQAIVSDIAGHKDDKDALKQDIYDFCEQWNGDAAKEFDQETIDKATERIQDILSITESELTNFIVFKKIYSEFNEQVRNIYTEMPGEINLSIKKDDVCIFIHDDDTVEVHDSNHLSLHTEAIYIDDPFVLDDIQSRISRREVKYENHRSHLIRKLSADASGNIVDDFIAKEKLNNVYNKISSVCGGEIVVDKRKGYGFRKAGSDKILNIHNLSSGLKAFVLIRMLLTNGTIEENGTIIMDEPEVHLHPEWQTFLAELIVLLHKEFGIHILLNTHSPYFLRAIQVYAAKYSVADKCKYYLSYLEEDFAKIQDVTDNIEKIYAKLADPIQKLEDIRWSDD